MSDFPVDPTADLPFAHGGAPLTGQLRAKPEDFQVNEVLGYAASGAGEHAFLHIRKTQLNTLDVAKRLAKHAGVKTMAVGFAGLKDKHAVTTQYFSVQLAGKPEPDWSALNDENLQVLDAQRHHRKIRRGTLQGNHFDLHLRDVKGDRTVAEKVLSHIKQNGVPNYFGQQRFGREASNLYQAQRWFAGELKRPKPEQKRMLISAARSHLFNHVLAERIRQDRWQQAIVGDVMLLEGTHKQFQAEALNSDIIQRAQALDIHPSGPLCGKPSRSLSPMVDAEQQEQAALQTCAQFAWIEKLKNLGIDADRRALRLRVSNLQHAWPTDDVLHLSFTLPAGSYATIVVRELVDISSV